MYVYMYVNSYAAGTTCFNEVVQEFGQEIVGQDGEIDRKVSEPIFIFIFFFLEGR
jgi:dephospho-CoA kinase